MAEPYSGIQYDATTGERLPADWRTPKTVVADMTGFDVAALNENIKNQGVERALKATEAAIQFQGQRGYQQALKNGESVEKAITKYGPMMFYRTPQAFAPSVRALTPPVVPQITPYQREVLDLRRQGLTAPGASSLPAEFQRDPNKEYITKGGALIPKVKPPAPEARSITIPVPGVEHGTQRVTPSELAKIQAEQAKADALAKANTPGTLPPIFPKWGGGKSTPLAAAKSPFAEGQRLKGKDGKFYRVKDGVPVPE